MVTETSGFDHLTKIDRQSSGMADTPRVVDVVLVQTPAGQASQTLENELRYECPPSGGCARQARALRLIAHVVMPLGVVRQHVTWSALPHTDRGAQFTTPAFHPRGKAPG